MHVYVKRQTMLMKFTHILKFKAVAIAAALLACIVSCSGPLDMEFSSNLSHPQNERPEGATLKETPNLRRVFVLFSFGYNNLSYDLNEDIEEMINGALPEYGPDKNVVLVLKHSTAKSSYYSQPSSPVLTQFYTKDGKIIRDTVKVYADTTVAARKTIVNDVLTIAKNRFPAKSYGMLISSHGTGWAPQGYCYSPPDKGYTSIMSLDSGENSVLEKYHQDRPLLKSIGAHYNGSAARSIEIEIQDLAEAIPMHLDYILFDACLMGGIEVAYELKDKCDQICFSQTEVLSGGMDYKNLLSSLFDYEDINLRACAENYFNMYKDQKPSYMRSATVSVVDCRRLDPLAAIVAKHAEKIRAMAETGSRNDVQGYFQPDISRYHGIFYDLEDIVAKSGATEEELDELRTALDECVLCKYATARFLDEFTINTHCGLSMYLYDSDRYILNKYYKTLKWEQKVRLIE